LTVSSLMVANGEPAHVVALVDPDSDLAAALESSGRAVVQLLAWRHRSLAEVFAETAPAPGGKFAQAEFVDTSWGPRLADCGTWAGVVLTDARPLGWSTLVTCLLEHLEVGEDDEPLVHRRGRFVGPPPS
jgi:flavin reductase (DIM6/NTAB) family NADH-FMN oxidoreductase RutF